MGETAEAPVVGSSIAELCAETAVRTGSGSSCFVADHLGRIRIGSSSLIHVFFTASGYPLPGTLEYGGQEPNQKEMIERDGDIIRGMAGRLSGGREDLAEEILRRRSTRAEIDVENYGRCPKILRGEPIHRTYEDFARAARKQEG